MAAVYINNPIYRYKMDNPKAAYFKNLTQAWYSIYRAYTERGEGNTALDLPNNARPSRKKMHAKLARYRKRVNGGKV